MKIIALFAFFVLGSAAAGIEYYKVPDLDVKLVCDDPVRLRAFVECLIDEAPCTDLMKSYKEIGPEAVKQTCRRCSPSLMHTGALFFQAAKLRMPAEYAKIRERLDPENKYFDAFEQKINKYTSIPNL